MLLNWNKRKFDDFLACLFICLLFNIFPMVMHMHIKLLNTFGNWLIIWTVNGCALSVDYLLSNTCANIWYIIYVDKSVSISNYQNPHHHHHLISCCLLFYNVCPFRSFRKFTHSVLNNLANQQDNWTHRGRSDNTTSQFKHKMWSSLVLTAG